MKRTLGEIARALGARIAGDAGAEIEGVASIARASPADLVFVEQERHLKAALQSRAGAVIAGAFAENSAGSKPLVIAAHPRLAFAKAAKLVSRRDELRPGIHPRAVVDGSASLGHDVAIDACAIVQQRARIGERTWIGAGSLVGEGVAIGDDCRIYPNVTIYPGTRIGNRVIIHSGTVIGSDGFGYVEDGEKHVKVPQVGSVIVEDDVEIGANVTIDRSTMGSTIIHQGVKIDNLVHIAHNCEIGDHSILCAQVGIAGTSKVGQSTILAGQVGISDHCEVGDQVIIGAQAGIPPKKKIPNQTQWAGTPARPWKEAIHSHAAMNRLPELAEEVKKLKDRIKKLEDMLA